MVKVESRFVSKLLHADGAFLHFFMENLPADIISGGILKMVVARAFGKSSADAKIREMERLAALDQFDLLDTPRDAGFDRIVRLIKQIFTVDIAIVSLIDAHRQWYKSCSGLAADEVPRDETFCQYVVDNEEPMIVKDAAADPRFAQHPAVIGETHVRFYAGVPLRTKEGHIIGTVCAIDRSSRSFSARDLGILQELAGAAMDRIELMQLAATDSLTGALTRRAFKQETDQLIALALRHKHPLSCIVLDIDHFKRVNDTYGHAAGDQVLRDVAVICKASLRTSDLFGRLGGEEFCIVLPHVDPSGAIVAAEKIRAAISSKPISCDADLLDVTVSMGISSLSIFTKDCETMLSQADAAMYHAKQNGRDRCIAFGSLGNLKSSARRRVLKAGSIIFNERRSTIDCTIKSIGVDGAAICLSNSAGLPSEFVLAIKADGFETICQIVAQDRQNVEVAFKL